MSSDERSAPHDRVAHRVTWFGPDRPVEGTGTVYVRPDIASGLPAEKTPAEVHDSAS